MSVFQAVRRVAPHLDATNIIELCEASELAVFIYDDTGRLQHVSRSVRDALAPGDEAATHGAEGDFAWLRGARTFDGPPRSAAPGH